MGTKKIVLLSGGIVLLILLSELVNYLNNPASTSSSVLNELFLERTIKSAGKNDFDKAAKYLFTASAVNSFGEYDHYRNLLPKGFEKEIPFPDNNAFKQELNKYLSSISQTDMDLTEDQGLGRIFYKLAIISYKNGYPYLTPLLLEKAIYNNPEFASFHAELINYYFLTGNLDKVSSEINYCFGFKSAKTMCEHYREESININIPREVGFLEDVVDKHYLSR